MSVQFGRTNIDGRPVDPCYLKKVKEMLAPYGPDGEGAYIKDGVGILFRAFHTTRESRSEAQPHITPSGAVLSWDGRLDNRAELIRELKDILTTASTDLSIVAAAHERWGTGCFARLLGDWALSIWNPMDQSLILAKDPIGTRHLYYSLDKDQVSWSTILDPLVLLAGKSFELEEEYIAGWLSFFPATHLTPYVGIHSVPPSTSVVIRAGKHTVTKYWEFDPGKRIRYRTDAEYEEHFRTVFAESVRRRLPSDSPILAELSGGMDSSSIVCMADTIIARGTAETPRLDTVSYYDDSEPNWNERPYFTRVEEERRRTGCHIDVGSQGLSNFEMEDTSFRATPGPAGRSSELSKRLASCMVLGGNRVVLSGSGGDEFTGGVSTPTPELEDLISRAQFKRLAHQLKLWALDKRKPWFHLLLGALRKFAPATLVGLPELRRPAPWFNPGFVKRNRAAFRGYEANVSLFGPLPSFQENIFTLEAMRRQLACDVLPLQPLCEKRYPFLDRSLLEFLCATPREQLVRPGQRRSLMRRALAGIVPDVLLNRKRKAFVTRAPMTDISGRYEHFTEMAQNLESGSLGIVDVKAFQEMLRKVRNGHVVPIVPLLRTIGIEIWLQKLRDHRLLTVKASKSNDNWLRVTTAICHKGRTPSPSEGSEESTVNTAINQ